jgi:hypothetical protein
MDPQIIEGEFGPAPSLDGAGVTSDQNSTLKRPYQNAPLMPIGEALG